MPKSSIAIDAPSLARLHLAQYVSDFHAADAVIPLDQRPRHAARKRRAFAGRVGSVELARLVDQASR